MIGALGDTLWLGLGIALNPIAIVISILVANRDNPRRNGVAFVLGWILGLGILVAAPALLIHGQFSLPDGGRRALAERYAMLTAALGTLLLLAAAIALVRGPLPGDHAEDPRWARILDRGGIGRVFGMGAFLATVNFRNLVLLAAAASVIGQAQLGEVEVLLLVAIFVAVATLGVLLPLLIHLVEGERSEARLRGWADWLTRHMGLITGAIMALFGALLLTRGVQGSVL